MIIDDVRGLAFVHIPKCGGMTVRRQLASIDSTSGAFFPIIEHPVLGRIHASHIPLVFLRDNFRADFDKIARYQSFALVRDPYTRFASAIFQRLMEFGGVPRIEITREQARAESRRLIRWLSGRQTYCNIEYIHFSRQSDFIELDGQTIVPNLYPLEHIGAMASAMHSGFGVTFNPEQRANTNFASRFPLLSVLHAAKPIYSRLTTWAFRERVLLLLKGMNLSQTEALYTEITSEPDIADFIERYYARDFTIYRAAKSRLSSGPETRRPWRSGEALAR
jgi:hypothetical protein